MISGGTGADMYYFINGNNFALTEAMGGGGIPVSFIVPNGNTYGVSGGSIFIWFELR
jgi:hypothetical protein